MALKWTMEALWTAIAIVFTTGWSVGTTIYHSGKTQAQMEAVQAKQIATDAHVAKHDDQLSAIQQTQAAQGQQLKDIADTVHDMHDNGVKRK